MIKHIHTFAITVARVGKRDLSVILPFEEEGWEPDSDYMPTDLLESAMNRLEISTKDFEKYVDSIYIVYLGKKPVEIHDVHYCNVRGKITSHIRE